jgi:hypothetical protein
MKKKKLFLIASTLGCLTALVGISIFLIYRDFETRGPLETSNSFPAFAKKEMAAELEKTLEFSKAEVAKAKTMLYKALDNIGEINFPDVITRKL